jgi:hypothetical protein
VNALYKYCAKTPAEVQYIVDRLVREWYCRVAERWFRFPYSRPALPRVPESRVTSVGIIHDHAIPYKNALANLGLSDWEAEVTSYLARRHIRTFSIPEYTKAIKKKW